MKCWKWPNNCTFTRLKLTIFVGKSWAKIKSALKEKSFFGIWNQQFEHFSRQKCTVFKILSYYCISKAIATVVHQQFLGIFFSNSIALPPFSLAFTISDTGIFQARFGVITCICTALWWYAIGAKYVSVYLTTNRLKFAKNTHHKTSLTDEMDFICSLQMLSPSNKFSFYCPISISCVHVQSGMVHCFR